MTRGESSGASENQLPTFACWTFSRFASFSKLRSGGMRRKISSSFSCVTKYMYRPFCDQMVFWRHPAGGGPSDGGIRVA